MTEEQILAELRFMAEFLEEIDWNTEIQEGEIPVLTAGFPLEEGVEETFICTYLPLDQEDAQYSKQLQFYCRIPLDLTAIPMAELLLLADRLNQITALGHFIWRPASKEEPQHLAIRYVWTMEADAMPEEGVLGELLLILLHYVQIAEGLLLRRLEGTGTEELLKQLNGDW